MLNPVIDRIREFALSLLPSMGLELYDLQFRREGHGWVLRLIIDSHEGVNLDDCSRVSREVSDFLDVEDLIEHAYHLEVSSPGVERELRNVRECERFLGEKIRVKLIGETSGQRLYVGELNAVDGTDLVVKTEEGKTCRFSWDTIKKIRLTL